MSRSRKVAYKASITNQCQGGGDKKAGLAPTATGQMLSMPFAWRAALGGITHLCNGGSGRANGGTACSKKFVISTVNQLGGIGRHRGMFRTDADGVNKNVVKSGVINCNKSMKNMKNMTNVQYKR